MSPKKRTPPTRDEGLAIASNMKQELLRQNYPVHNVYLYGSVARGEAHEWSDIDIAVVCDSFDVSKIREAQAFYKSYPQLDPRAQIVILHPEEKDNPFSIVASAVQEEGLTV